jgi:hypothetical protein
MQSMKDKNPHIMYKAEAYHYETTIIHSRETTRTSR